VGLEGAKIGFHPDNYQEKISYSDYKKKIKWFAGKQQQIIKE
jgi:hypothetical protein